MLIMTLGAAREVIVMVMLQNTSCKVLSERLSMFDKTLTCDKSITSLFFLKSKSSLKSLTAVLSLIIRLYAIWSA